ncbi:hypothetical protein L9F63_017709 [Diploptera punctata]|uniref:Uncharacterized protein n=1 Tax=Diploptera punctata TaxID=6984 RepID=A0AAD7ZYC5_DIPPU|nr:hypothetical protein L9F63_017709 [Diploptera punctata]
MKCSFSMTTDNEGELRRNNSGISTAWTQARKASTRNKVKLSFENFKPAVTIGKKTLDQIHLHQLMSTIQKIPSCDGTWNALLSAAAGARGKAITTAGLRYGPKQLPLHKNRRLSKSLLIGISSTRVRFKLLRSMVFFSLTPHVYGNKELPALVATRRNTLSARY